MGITQFGRAWQYVMENDTHAPGSVDRVLMGQMVRLCPETASYLYNKYTSTEIKVRQPLPELKDALSHAIAGCKTEEECVEGIARFTSGLADNFDWYDLESMIVGGTEEEIIARGSDWCVDVARVACVLCQLAGLPARLVYLFNMVEAHCGHSLIEAYRDGIWGTVDSSTLVIYRHKNGRPASTWDLMNDPKLIEAHARKGAAYTKVNQFGAAGMVNYSVWNRKQYDYTTSGINDYSRSILEMANKGWPGGLRWLHGEDSY